MRGQAAMEFLATYGWAITVVLIAIGALAYFGVLDPSMFTPEKATISSGFEIRDFRLTEQQNLDDVEVEFVLVNNNGRPVILLGGTRNITCPDCEEGYQKSGISCGGTYDYENSSWYAGLAPGTDVTLPSEGTFLYQCNPLADASIVFKSAGRKDRVLVSFDYMFAGKDFVHHAEGEIVAEVQDQIDRTP